MKIRETVSSSDWSQRPQRARRISPEIREIVRAASRSKLGEWVVISISEDEKKRQPTIRGRIQSAALQQGFQVKFEMRAGDLGIQRMVRSS